MVSGWRTTRKEPLPARVGLGIFWGMRNSSKQPDTPRVRIDHRKTAQLFLLYAMVGTVAGVGAIVFQQLLSLLNIFVMQGVVGFLEIQIVSGLRRFSLPWEAPALRAWLLPVVAGTGGLITGLLVQRFAPEAAGHGTDEVIEAYHQRDGEMRLRASITKLFASAITLGTGGSGGKEGPIAQIGAGFGSFLCTRIPMYRPYRRQIMLAGMSAGIAAIFRAPLAGAIFAAEVLYSEMNFNGKAIIPAVIASAVAYGVYSIYFGFSTAFVVPPFVYSFSLSDLAVLTVIGVLCAWGAILFIRVFYGLRNLFVRLPLDARIKPAIGGILTGLIAMRLPEALGEGSMQLQRMIDGGYTWWFLVILLVGKMITTGFSVGSGGSAGIFGPSLFLGAALGGAFAGLYGTLIPGTTIPPVMFVLLGMVGFFAGAANAPISTAIIVAEMTGVYSLFLPFLWVAVIGYLFSQRWNIYENQAPITGNILER